MAAKPRYDWFQSDTDVVLSIMKRGVDLDDCSVVLTENNYLTVKYRGEVIFEGQLASGVKKDDRTVKCTNVKVEIRLPKAARNVRWPTLLTDGQNNAAISESVKTNNPISNPSTAPKKNWDAIEKQAVKEEEDEQLEGDAAVNKMFRKIYESASEDVRRAMMKSYSESNGTVLSTNWAEISQKKVECQPPPCMEYKQYEK